MNFLPTAGLVLCLGVLVQAPPDLLEPGKPFDRDIGAGEVHTYELRARAGQFLQTVITPRQSDVKATLTAPDGKTMVVVDALSRQGPEEITWILPAAGSYRITVKATGAAAYSLLLRHLRDPADEDRPRAAAFQAFTAAELLAAQANAESRTRAAAKYEEALAGWRSLGDVFWEGRVLHQIAFNLEAMGELIKARDALLAALPLRRAVGNRNGEANTLNNLGIVYNGLGEPATALEYLSSALEIRKAFQDRRSEAVTLNNMAISHSRLGDPARAIEVLLRSLEIRREVGDRLGEAITLNNLGAEYREMGDMQAALDRYAEALAYRRQVGDRRGEAAGLTNVGNVYRALGEPKKAGEYWLQAAAAFEAVGDRRGLAVTFASLGMLGDGPDARRYLDRALAIRREIGDRQGEVLSLADISAVQFRRGEYRTAGESADAALELARRIGFQRGEGISLYHAANADLKLGDRDRARNRLTEAAAFFRSGGNRENESLTLARLAELELSDGNLQPALAYSRLALGLSETIRGSVASSELRASFRAYRDDHYGLYVDVLMSLHQKDPSGGFDVLALEASERARSRSLVERLAESSIGLRQALSPAERQREDQILDRIHKAHGELFRSGSPAAGKPEVERQLAAAERDLDTFQLELRKGGSGSPAAVEYVGALDRDRIQREILGQDTALIEFALGEKQSYVWVLTPRGGVSAVLPPRQQIKQHVEEYRKELAQRPSALTVRTALTRVDALGAKLYRDLLAPIESALRDSQRLIIVPDGILAYLPFETLGGEKRLIERFAVSYSPSASVLATLRGRSRESSPPTKELLAFGDAVYSPAGAPERSALGQSSERGLDLTQLPHTRTEVTSIRSLFPAGASRVYMGAEAREDTVKSEPLDSYRFIHFAVHGLYDEEKPERSGIALSVNPDSREDGILQVREIMRLRLRAEMVTLSACQTGLGKLLDGEGVVGMSRAFLYAGSNSVLTSLWNVNDASTAELMRLVYRDLARGLRRDDALRAAKLQLIRGPQSTWRHPYYWAPFVLLGDSAPVSR